MILSTHFEGYEKGEVLQDTMRSLFGTGVFNSDGLFPISLLQAFLIFTLYRGAMEVSRQNEMVYVVFVDVSRRFHRSMTRPFFSKDRISDFELFDRHADQVIVKIKERFKDNIPVDIQDVFSRFTMDTATEFLFGQDVKTLSGDLPYPSTYKKPSTRTHPSDQFAFAFNRAQENTFPRGFYGKLWPLVNFWEDVVATDKRVIWKSIDPLIQAALEKKKIARGVYELNRDDGTLLDHLVEQTDGTRVRHHYYNPEVLMLCRFRHHQRRDP